MERRREREDTGTKKDERFLHLSFLSDAAKRNRSKIHDENTDPLRAKLAPVRRDGHQSKLDADSGKSILGNHPFCGACSDTSVHSRAG
jgi:hypothetical protein